MIIHLCCDETFIDNCIIDVFNRIYPKKNTYVVISKKEELLHIKKKDQVLVLHPTDDTILTLCNQATSVIVHLMTVEKAFWVAQINKKVNVLWYCWGIDFYNINEFESFNFSIYEPLTKNVVETQYYQTLLKKIKHKLAFIRIPYHQLKKNIPFLHTTLDKAFHRVNYISTIVPSEYNLIKKTLPLNKTAQYLNFKYGSMQMLLGAFYNKEFELGNNILLGNSCSYTNNHHDALEFLSKLKINQPITCPLSYGNAINGKIVKKKGKELFQQNFIALTEYLPLEEYVKTTTSCSVMILNNRRQEAAGNILLGLYLGMRVYLNNKNPIYSYFKEQQLIIFDFYSDFKNTKECLSPLNTTERNHNRIILEKLWGQKVVEQQILEAITLLSK